MVNQIFALQLLYSTYLHLLPFSPSSFPFLPPIFLLPLSYPIFTSYLSFLPPPIFLYLFLFLTSPIFLNLQSPIFLNLLFPIFLNLQSPIFLNLLPPIFLNLLSPIFHLHLPPSPLSFVSLPPIQPPHLTPTFSFSLTSGKAWKSLVKDSVWWVVLLWSLSWPYLRLARRLRFSCHRSRWPSSQASSSPKNSRVSFFTYLQVRH